MNNQDLKKYLRILKSKRISSEDVAKRMTMTRSYISRLANGHDPISQSFEDQFVLEFKKDLEGVELIDVSKDALVNSIVALEAKVEVLTESFLGLQAIVNELLKEGLSVKEVGRRAKSAHLAQFDELVANAAAQILKQRGKS